jgi:hypothetical protein
MTSQKGLARTCLSHCHEHNDMDHVIRDCRWRAAQLLIYGLNGLEFVVYGLGRSEIIIHEIEVDCCTKKNHME